MRTFYGGVNTKEIFIFLSVSRRDEMSPIRRPSGDEEYKTHPLVTDNYTPS